MNIMVGVQDQDGNTDNIILVNTTAKTLTWIPRDLFSFYLRDRVNRAFDVGGHPLFLNVLKHLGFPADYSVCVSNEAIREVLCDYEITVPVKHSADYYYPLKAFEPIENGQKIVSFSPPFETLIGERIHQFLGARYRINTNECIDLPDFERIARQMVFAKQRLIEKFDFTVFLTRKIFVSDPKAINYLAQVNAEYQCNLYRKCRPFIINRSAVLITDDKWLVTLNAYLLNLYFLFFRALRKIQKIVLRSVT